MTRARQRFQTSSRKNQLLHGLTRSENQRNRSTRELSLEVVPMAKGTMPLLSQVEDGWTSSKSSTMGSTGVVDTDTNVAL